MRDDANARMVCERDADCPKDICWYNPKAKPRCDASDVEGIRVCACP